MTPSIRAQLLQTAGVNPSEDWITACLTHLRLTNTETADAVLHQVLHSDLRDVVRPISSGAAPSDGAHAVLRSNIHQSQQSEARKAVLPASFRLMIQVEELLDVSLNAEKRFSVGPASPSAPTPVGNQSSRLLKLFVADGHVPPLHLIAMEISPIRNISVQSLAGIKVLLKGPLEIRHGMLQLHPGCATVLGGKVDHLVTIQRQALEQAQRVAGVGVDPTVRALIGTTPIEQEQEDDEGEAESGDVSVRARVPPQRVVPLPPRVPAAPPQARPETHRVQQQTTVMAHAQRRNGPGLVTPQPGTSSHTQMRSEPQRVSQQSAAVEVQRRPPQPSQPVRSGFTTASALHQQTLQQRQPLASQPPQQSRQQIPVARPSRTNPYARKSPVVPPSEPALTPVSNPYARNVVTAATTATPRIPATASRPAETTRNTNPYAAAPPSTRNTQPTTAPSSMGTRMVELSMDSENRPINVPLSSQASSSQDSYAGIMRDPLSFEELVSLLQRVVNDKKLYEQYVGKVFVVPAKMKGAQKYFNIDKKNKKARKKNKNDDKYEYVMNCSFTGTGGAEVLVVIADDILREHFELPPGEMRKLSRENRPASQKFVDEGGRAVMKELYKLRSFEMTLRLPAGEYFAQDVREVNGGDPILRVLRYV